MVAAENQLVLHIPTGCVGSLSYLECNAKRHIVICGMPGSPVFVLSHMRQDVQNKRYQTQNVIFLNNFCLKHLSL